MKGEKRWREETRSWDLDWDKHNVKMSRNQNNINKKDFKGAVRKTWREGDS